MRVAFGSDPMTGGAKDPRSGLEEKVEFAHRNVWCKLTKQYISR